MTAVCSVEGCDSGKIAARGLCWKHYLRWNRYGDTSVNKMKNHLAGRYDGQDGYVMIHLGGNDYQAEHVLMAEAALGHSLPEGVVVHHVDGDRSNNNTKGKWNLVLCPDHAYHMILHRRARMLGYEDAWPGAKLTEVQADEIRDSRSSERKTAAEYGISRSTVRAIRAGTLKPPIGETR